MNSLPHNPNLHITYRMEDLKEIYLAGGCFWGVDAYMRRVKGVAATQAGYANGRTVNPTYEDVCRRNTGHAETVKVLYDPSHISLGKLLDQFFSIIDPTSVNRQGGDFGEQYRTGVYYANETDVSEIESAFAHEQAKHVKKIVTELMPLKNYYPAEDYHQDYLEKNPNGYCHVSFDHLRE